MESNLGISNRRWRSAVFPRCANDEIHFASSAHKRLLKAYLEPNMGRYGHGGWADTVPYQWTKGSRNLNLDSGISFLSSNLSSKILKRTEGKENEYTCRAHHVLSNCYCKHETLENFLLANMHSMHWKIVTLLMPGPKWPGKTSSGKTLFKDSSLC